VSGAPSAKLWCSACAAAVALLVLVGAGCGSNVGSARAPVTSMKTATSPALATTTTATKVATARHIMVVMMENKDFSQVIGQSDQPFTNSLVADYGLATKSYAFGHPSLPNYLDIVSGSNRGVAGDGPPASHLFPAVATLADQLVTAGFSAKAYAEDLPSDPTRDSGEYAVRHFPWEYFPQTKIAVSDASSVLFDLNGANPPDFVWYTPNLIDDEHDGSVEQGDAFLSRFVTQVQSTTWYRSDGEIIVEWDESGDDDSGINGGGGGHVPTIVVSAALKASPRRDPTPVDTTGILRSIEDAYHVGHLTGAADAANGTIDALLDAGRAHGS